MAKKDEGYTEELLGDEKVYGEPKPRPYAEALSEKHREVLASAGQLPD